jgi:hypothetical protein
MLVIRVQADSAATATAAGTEMVIPGADENSAALQISPAALQNSDAPAAFHSSLVAKFCIRTQRVE